MVAECTCGYGDGSHTMLLWTVYPGLPFQSSRFYLLGFFWLFGGTLEISGQIYPRRNGQLTLFRANVRCARPFWELFDDLRVSRCLLASSRNIPFGTGEVGSPTP
jgi:hypothetical protein